jgi:hypothetical protein
LRKAIAKQPLPFPLPPKNRRGNNLNFVIAQGKSSLAVTDFARTKSRLFNSSRTQVPVGNGALAIRCMTALLLQLHDDSRSVRAEVDVVVGAGVVHDGVSVGRLHDVLVSVDIDPIARPSDRDVSVAADHESGDRFERNRPINDPAARI